MGYSQTTEIRFRHSEIHMWNCGDITKHHERNWINGGWVTKSIEVYVTGCGPAVSLPVERQSGETWRQAAIRVGKAAKQLAEDMCNKVIKQSADDPNPCEEDKRTIEEWADEMERDQENYEQYIAEFAESQSMGVDTETLNYSYCHNTSRYIDL